MDAMTQPSIEGPKGTCSLGRRVLSVFAAVYSYLSFSFVRPLVDKAHKDELNERSATEISLDPPSIKDLADKFEEIYQRFKVFYGPEKAQRKNLVVRTIAIQYLPIFLFHVLWVTLETAIRLAAPFFLRQFLLWIEDYNDDKAEYYGGWMWGLLLVSCVLGFMLLHHRYVWQGAIIGYRAKYSLISLVHAKLLRLNSSMIAKLTTGHIVNLISSDIKRFEMTFILWLYVIFGPLETIAVLFMVSSVLGFLPALGGLGCILLTIPLQSFFAGCVARFRGQTAVVTDKRVGCMEELITGSLAVKMLVWEDPLMDKINTMRDTEDKLLKKTNYIKANSMALYSYIQIVMMCIIMILLRSTGEEFNVPDVFFAISLLALPRLTMTLFFAVSVQQLSELLVSTRRLDEFFKIPEPEPLNPDIDDSSTRGNLSVVNGCYGWHNDNNSSTKNKQKQSKHQILTKHENLENEERCKNPKMTQTLSDIEFQVQTGELIGIVGRVGSGKSSILSALLNDMEILNRNSSVQISGTVAYSAQVPFIIAATLRENIIFGRQFDEALYNCVISSCALNVDIEHLPLGDATILGERGINLSGGQKARVALARAAYFKADINLLDDPLSAVDARVGRILFEKCIGGDNAIMKDSTRLFVTHQKQFLASCDRIILMNNGRIEHIGRWDQLKNHPLLKVEKQIDSEQQLTLNASSDVQNNHEESKEKQSLIPSVNEKEEGVSDLDQDPSEDDNGKQMVKAEGKEHGKIGKKVYWDYLHHIGVLPMILSLGMLILSKVLYFGAEWWVAKWASAEEDEQDDQMWIWILIGLTITVAFAASIAVFSIFRLLVHGSTQLHKAMVKSVLHAPLRFFHMNPTGRILNRFSKDLGMQDDELPILTADVLIVATQLIGTLVLILIALPFTLPVIILIAFLFRKIQKQYIVPSRDIKRYDGLTRSPIYAMFSLNMKGVSTIRAFGREKDFQKSILDSLDLNSSWWLSFLATSRWFGFKLDGISVCIAFSAIVAAILASKIVSEEILALALTNALGLSGTLQWCMRQIAELENTMTAVERNLEYTRLEQEPLKGKEGGGEAPDSWPTDACIEFKSVSASYRPGLDPVLKDVSFKIPGGCSVGIVGRTGSGKSSLLLTLFRLIDINGGSICINDVDTSTIGIDVLRKQIAVIPQDPVLFGGTFRSNLDPWKEFSDVRLWGVLQEVHLDSAVNAFGGLDAPISESGNNLSVGQRQLLCLARALLGESKILALDEATANVDHVTDALIQTSLRAVISQKEKTLLIIAHRINTILDCDLLLVLDNGKKAEFGSPMELLAKQEGCFKGMVEAVKRASNTCLD